MKHIKTPHQLNESSENSNMSNDMFSFSDMIGYRMKYLKKFKLFESKNKKYTGKERIIILGPPTIGKSTISKALSEKLDIKVIHLDMLQGKKFGGFSDEKEIECVEWVLENGLKTPSILDFGGGHIYKGKVKDLIKDYKNVFVLIPSEDFDKSQEILKQNSRHHLFEKIIKHIIKSIEDHDCEFSDTKKEKVLKLSKKLLSGSGGSIEKNDIPKKTLEKFPGDVDGFELSSGWNNTRPSDYFYTRYHDKINRKLTKNIIQVFTKKGNRRSVDSILNEIIEKLV
jgi:shikimate kinase